MNQSSALKPQSLSFGKVATYLMATAFICGNIILPQLCHQIPWGGITWLPIYFFTLVGAYLYGWRVGILTALVSPLVNSLLFGMPAPAVLPAIMLKSSLLAIFAAYAAWKTQKVSISAILTVVLSYQVVGTLGEWAMTSDLVLAFQDFRMGIPGMMLQIFGGWTIMRGILRFNN